MPSRSTSPTRPSCRAMVDRRAVERFGRLDILVNNAGINIRKPPRGLRARRVAAACIDTNLTSAFLCCQAAYPLMKQRRRRQDHQHRLDDVDLRRRRSRPPTRASKGGIVQLTQVAGDRVGQGQHPGQRGAAGLDRHRPHAGARASRSRACTSACSRARRPGAGACPTTSPASPCSWPARLGLRDRHGDPGRRRLLDLDPGLDSHDRQHWPQARDPRGAGAGPHRRAHPGLGAPGSSRLPPSCATRTTTTAPVASMARRQSGLRSGRGTCSPSSRAAGPCCSPAAWPPPPRCSRRCRPATMWWRRRSCTGPAQLAAGHASLGSRGRADRHDRPRAVARRHPAGATKLVWLETPANPLWDDHRHRGRGRDRARAPAHGWPSTSPSPPRC